MRCERSLSGCLAQSSSLPNWRNMSIASNWPGRINSLAQTLMRFTAPGVPDTYQGGELWDLRLVDPDNRAPVDYDERRALLAELKAGMSAEQIMERMESGLPKLWVTHCAMKLRQSHPEWFGAEAAYLPLPVEGHRQNHVIAYLRGESVATCVPRWSAKLNGSWSSTAVTLPEGQWRNLLTGDRVAGGSVRMQALLRALSCGAAGARGGVGNASVRDMGSAGEEDGGRGGWSRVCDGWAG